MRIDNLNSGEIVCAELTTEDVGDSTVLPDLLAQVSSPIEGFLADGAYDGFASRDLISQRFGPDVTVVIPPPETAILSSDPAQNPTARDHDAMEIFNSWEYCLAGVIRLQSTQPDRDTNGPLEGRDRRYFEGAQL